MMRRARRFRHLVRWQLRGLAHQRVLWILGSAALGVALSGGILRTFHFGGDAPRFHAGVAMTGLWMAGTLLAALLAPSLVGQPGESRIEHCLFARGVQRGEWIGAAFASLVAVQGGLLLLIGTALAVTLHGQGHAAELAAALSRCANQAGGLLVLSAVAVLLAAIFQRALAASAAIAGFGLAMQLEPVFARMASVSGGAGAVFWRTLDLLVPGGAAVDGQAGAVAALGVAGYVLVYLALATLIHAQREF